MDDVDDSNVIEESQPNEITPASLFVVEFEGRKKKWKPSSTDMRSKEDFFKGLEQFLNIKGNLFVEYEDKDLEEFVELENLDQLPNQTCKLKVNLK